MAAAFATNPAVQRRIRMLLAGGAADTAIGFQRSSEPVAAAIEGIVSVDLGRTADGMLARRQRDPRPQPRDACTRNSRPEASRSHGGSLYTNASISTACSGARLQPKQ